jgi:ribosomal protein S27AE
MNDAAASIAITVAHEPCPRCGTYAELSDHGPRRLCAECVARGTHPVERTPMATWPLLEGVATLLGAMGLRGAVAVVLLQLPAAMLTVAMPGVTTALASMLATLLGTGVVTALGLEEVDGPGTSRLAHAGATVLGRVGPLIGGTVLANVIIGLLALLCLVPGVVRALSYMLVVPLILRGEHGVRDALRASRIRMHGSRARIFPAVLLVGSLLVAIVIVQGIAVQVLWWEQGMHGPIGLFGPRPLEVRVLEATGQLAMAVGTMPVTLLAVVVWAKLRAGRG